MFWYGKELNFIAQIIIVLVDVCSSCLVFVLPEVLQNKIPPMISSKVCFEPQLTWATNAAREGDTHLQAIQISDLPLTV